MTFLRALRPPAVPHGALPHPWLHRLVQGALAPTVLLLAACAGTVPPPPAPPEAGPAFKETGLWTSVSSPAPAVTPDWWKALGDPVLDDLQRQLLAENATLQQLASRVAVARATLGLSEAAGRPTAGASLGTVRSDNLTSTRPQTVTTLGFSANWELDLWGRQRLGEQGARASLQASEADLAAGRLSVQAALAQLYVSLRAAEVQQALLERSIAAYQRAIEVTKGRYDAGVTSGTDVLQAEVQWRTAQAQLIETGIQRSQHEHAMAVLVGKAPVNFSIARTGVLPSAPLVPQMLPSTLLERRPDIAAAQQRVIAANTQIGLARTAYFPSLTLSASAGYRTTRFSDLFDVPNRFWSFGPQLAGALLDGGARKAATQQAIAAADGATAAYRLTVLTALQEVEDNLVLADRLRDQALLLEQSRQAGQRTLDVTMGQYQAGTVGYLNVVSAQTVLLSSERAHNEARSRELQAIVQLLKNSAGGW